jgi:diguanylate cyclase (GGDEF)-like protein/PAS domain S-box-containing protein
MSPLDPDLLDAVAAAVLVADPAGRVVATNSSAVAVLGGRPGYLQDVALTPADGPANLRRTDGAWFDARIEARPFGAGLTVITVHEDRPGSGPGRQILAHVGMGSWDWHIPTGRVEFDERWRSMLGYDELPNDLAAWERLVHPQDRERVDTALQEHLAGRTPTYSCEHRCRHRDGHYVWVLDTGRVVERDRAGRPLRATGIHMDISARKHHEAQRERLIAELKRARAALEDLVRVDELTGLGNRRVLNEALDRAWPASIGRGEALSIMVVDLDGFKDYNDRHGHAAADDVLRAVSMAMTAEVRSRDTITRFGGDEFVVVMPGAGAGAAERAGQRVRRAVAAASPVTASVGVAVWTPGCDMHDPQALFSAADAALYDAKAAGRDCVRTWVPAGPASRVRLLTGGGTGGVFHLP